MPVKTLDLLPVLEYDDHERHRIVVWKSNGTTTQSDWAPISESISLEDKWFVAGIGTPFPQGQIFSVRILGHRILM